MGLLFCCFAHPLLLVDALSEGDLKVSDKFGHSLLGTFGKVFFNIHLPDGHAQDRLDSGNATLPTRTILLGSAHDVSVEVEGFLAEIVAQRASGIIHQFEIQICLQVFNCALG